MDIAIETGSFVGNVNDSTPVTCDEGRVILAASAYTGSVGSGATAVPVVLDDGDLTDTCHVATTAAVTVHYTLTTGRVATL